MKFQESLAGDDFWTKAYSLALASKVSYRTNEVVSEVTGRWGFGKCEHFESSNTEGFVASNSEIILIAFRGTDGQEDLKLDLTFTPIKVGDHNFHRGFRKAFEDVEGELRQMVRNASPESKKLYFTGHSLGGALATIAAAELSEEFTTHEIFTYGQPGVGTASFAGFYNNTFPSKSFRFVNKGDIIPKVPPGFSHTEKELFLDADGIFTRGGEPVNGPAHPGDTETWTEEELAKHRDEVIAVLEEQKQYAKNEQTPGRTRFFSFEPHLIDSYIKRIGRQITSATRGDLAIPGPQNEFTPADTNEPVCDTMNTGEVDPWKHKQNQELSHSDALPLSIHVLWSPQCNEYFNPCRESADKIFTFLNHIPGNEHDLEAGVGIPVFMGHHFDDVREKVENLSAAGDSGSSRIIVVVMLHVSALFDIEYDEFVRWLFSRDWNQGNRINILPAPVWFDRSWYGEPAYEIHASKGAIEAKEEIKSRIVAREVGTEICRYLMNPRKNDSGRSKQKINLLLSYTPLDSERTEYIAAKIFDSLTNSEANEIFAPCDLPNDRSPQTYSGQNAIDNTVFLLIKTDSYSLDSDCQKDLLDAKRFGIPVISLNILANREQRSLAYGGNSITLAGDLRRWTKDFRQVMDACEAVCVQALLRHLHFHHSAPSIFKRRGMNITPRYLSRPPELVDFAQGPLNGADVEIVLYPDPPVPEIEAELIRHAYKRTRITTPTTLSLTRLKQSPTPPLNGRLIALSLSESVEDLAKKTHQIDTEYIGSTQNGVFEPHLNAAIAYITLSLVRAGASLGYGGNLRGYSRLLTNLVAAHRQTRNTEDQAVLHSFIAAYLWDKQPPTEGEFQAKFERIPEQGIPSATEPWAMALELSLMRQKMAERCNARIVLGGKSRPKKAQEDNAGYAGRFPGQAEEALRHLLAGKPVYIVGGFYGAARRIAQALKGEIEDLPGEADFQAGFDEYGKLCADYAEHYGDFESLKSGPDFPKNLDDLWRSFAEIGKDFFNDSEHQTGRWVPNGLSREENEILFYSVEIDEISSLILKGLNNLKQEEERDNNAPLNVSLFNGSITDVLNVESYGSLILRSDKLRGADGALDQHVQGEIRKRLISQEPETIIKVNSDQLEGDYIFVDFLEQYEDIKKSGEDDIGSLEQGIANGIQKITRRAEGHGIGSIALVPSGANLGLDINTSVRTIIDAVITAGQKFVLNSIVICEIDPERYQSVVAATGHFASCCPTRKITITEMPSKTPTHLRPSLSITLRTTNEEKEHLDLEQIISGPDSCGAVGIDNVRITMQELEDLAYPQIMPGRLLPPPFEVHEELGRKLAKMVLPEKDDTVLANRSRYWDVLHDIDASVIPLELFAFPIPGADGQHFRPALEHGIRRGLLVEDLPPFSPHDTVKPLRLLIIVADPIGNIPCIEKEAEMIQEKLKASDVEIDCLFMQDATLEKVHKKLKSHRYDFVHFSGHGEKHGLLLQDQNVLSGDQLEKFEVEFPPMMVMANACKSGEVRDTSAGVSLAQQILRSGVKGFISNRWEVTDNAAAFFAVTVYEEMASGKTLGSAILKGRNGLFQSKSPDWANYVLYGSPEIKI
ncbi:MAG: CHAT domain-containing protein [Verrucomicrobiales bacterium]|nr:CHAT domain-containing protein [Verrucomicrobiales bacterium]